MFLEFSTHEWVEILWKLVRGGGHAGVGLCAVSVRLKHTCPPTCFIVLYCSL